MEESKNDLENQTIDADKILLDEQDFGKISDNHLVKKKSKKGIIFVFVILIFVIFGVFTYLYINNTASLNEKIIEENVVRFQTNLISEDKDTNISKYINGNLKVNIDVDAEIIPVMGENINTSLELNDYKFIKNLNDFQFSTNFKLGGDLGLKLNDFFESNPFIDIVIKDEILYLGVKGINFLEELLIDFEYVEATNKAKYIKIGNVQNLAKEISNSEEILADLKVILETPFFEVKEQVGDKFYLQVSRNLCDYYFKILEYNSAGFSLGTCTDEVYNQILTSFESVGKFYVSGNINNYEIGFEGVTNDFITENNGYIRVVKTFFDKKSKIDELYYSLKLDESNDFYISYKDDIIEGLVNIDISSFSILDTLNLTEELAKGTIIINGDYKDDILDLNIKSDGVGVLARNLALIGTSLQGYSIDARDAKRISDIRALYTKINIESIKGKKLSDLITTKRKNSIIINGKRAIAKQGVVNFKNLNENGKNFVDPLTNEDYIFVYVEGDGYSFLQTAAIEEKTNTIRLVGNYFQSDENDSISLIKVGNDFVTDGGPNLLYKIDSSVSDLQDEELKNLLSNITSDLNILLNTTNNNNDFNIMYNLSQGEKNLIKIEIDNKSSIQMEKLPEVIIPKGAIELGDLYESQLKKARDSNRMTDIFSLQSAIEQFYQDKAKYPVTQEDWTGLGISITSYMPNLAKDPLGFVEIDGCKFGYFYEVGIDKQTYRLSTCFEDKDNIQNRATNVNDGGVDDKKYERGMNLQGKFETGFYINGTEILNEKDIVWEKSE